MRKNPLQPPATPSEPPTAAARSGQRGRVLLLEDDDDTRGVLCRLLEARGFEVSAVGTVAEAWDRSAAARFDLLLSDIGLPDGDGYRLMRELQDLQGLKGIALTGYGLEDDVALSREAGFAVHITKPIQIQVLEAALDQLVPRRPA